MNHPLEPRQATTRLEIKERLKVLHQDHGGTSLTEFIIGVPVMLIVIVGMMGMYQLNMVGISAKMEATEKAWNEAIDVQEKFAPKKASLSTTVSGIQDLAGIVGSFKGGFGAGINATIADPPGGVFIDSYVKLRLADLLFKFDKKPRWNVEEIMKGENTDEESKDIDPSGSASGSDSKLAAMVIHDDMPLGGVKDSKSIFGVAIAAGGVRLSTGAGLRYGHTRDKSQSYSGTIPGGFSYTMGERYRIDYPTKSVNRLPGLALAYYTQVYDHPIDKGTELYDEGITTFEVVPKIHRPDFGDAPEDANYDEEATSEEVRECEEGMKKYNDCVKGSVLKSFCNGKKPECMKGNNAGDKATKFTNCVHEAVLSGKDSSKECGEGPT